MQPIPDTVQDVTTTWLTEALRTKGLTNGCEQTIRACII